MDVILQKQKKKKRKKEDTEIRITNQLPPWKEIDSHSHQQISDSVFPAVSKSFRIPQRLRDVHEASQNKNQNTKNIKIENKSIRDFHL